MAQYVARALPELSGRKLGQRDIPRLAKDPKAVRAIERAVRELPTHHAMHVGDAREMSCVADGSVQLVLTSPPYWTLKKYPAHDAQLGGLGDYEQFLGELDKVWAECYRVLEKGGRLIVVVGDVCLSRRRHGAHKVLPLHAAIQQRAGEIGFHNLAPIIWYKIANAAFEVEGGTGFLGKPYEPNAVIKNDVEFILMFRKPGGYRQPSDAMRVLSLIGEENHRKWFNQILDLRGASTRHHPAPYPRELAERLIRMFSFVGDTVLDPFSGTGTTGIAAAAWGRNSVSFEIEKTYYKLSRQRFADVIGREHLHADVSPPLSDVHGERHLF
jgi:DNA modification methylase